MSMEGGASLDGVRAYAVTAAGSVREADPTQLTSDEHVLLAASPDEARARAQAYFARLAAEATAPDEDATEA
jgi:hypothetical protein